ncbi:hypothetical protein WJX84_001493 [Apatococcus fuscideae]|uniref:Transforming acidic coiled-coil-containing protein C-terminal domain-containing protein n=1 Tax=Apatococcus fuscideae TaxID=2026836 RepID=A0AAW1T2Y5_9CHLO
MKTSTPAKDKENQARSSPGDEDQFKFTPPAGDAGTSNSVQGSRRRLVKPLSPEKSKKGPGNAQTASHPSAAGGQPGATVHGAGIPPTISLSRVNEVSEGSSSPGGKQLSSAVEVNSATPNGVTSAESIPGRFLARGLSALKIQAGNPGDDAHAGHDKPGSPSPLRDGLAYMTPLSAFGPDTSPQPRGSSPGVTAGGDADQRTPPVAAQTGSSVWPKMQALDEPEDHAASMALINNFRRASERATSPQAASPVALIEPQPNVALEPTPASVSPLAPIPPTAVPHVMPTNEPLSAEVPAPEDMKTGDLSGLAPLDGPALAGPAISSPCPGPGDHDSMSTGTHAPRTPTAVVGSGVTSNGPACNMPEQRAPVPAPTPRNAFSLLSVGTVWDEPRTPAIGIPVWTDAGSPEATPVPFSAFMSRLHPSNDGRTASEAPSQIAAGGSDDAGAAADAITPQTPRHDSTPASGGLNSASDHLQSMSVSNDNAAASEAASRTSQDGCETPASWVASGGQTGVSPAADHTKIPLSASEPHQANSSIYVGMPQLARLPLTAKSGKSEHIEEPRTAAADLPGPAATAPGASDLHEADDGLSTAEGANGVLSAREYTHLEEGGKHISARATAQPSQGGTGHVNTPIASITAAEARTMSADLPVGEEAAGGIAPAATGEVMPPMPAQYASSPTAQLLASAIVHMGDRTDGNGPATPELVYPHGSSPPAAEVTSVHAKHTRRGIAAAAASTPAADGAMVKGLPAGSQAREQAAAPGWVASFVLLPEGAAGSPVRAADDAALAVPSWQTPIHVRSISPHTADLSTPVELPLSAEHEPHRGALAAATEVTSTPMRHASGRVELSENSEPEGAASGLDSPEFAPEFAQEVARMLLASSPKSSPGAPEDVLDLISPGTKTSLCLTPEELAGLVPELQELQAMSRQTLLRHAVRSNVEACGLARDKAELLSIHQDRSALIQQLRDEKSQAEIRATTRQHQLEVQLAQARQSMSEIDGKFRMLYQEKYVPLKAQLKRHLELQDSLTQQHSDAFQACQDLQSVLEASKQEKDQLRAELQTSQEQTAFASNEAEAAREALVAAAQEQQASADASFMSRVTAAEEAAALAETTSKARQQQVQKGQAEMEQLQQKVADMDTLLRRFKHQNDRFAATKGQYEEDMRKLASQMQDKADENGMLLRMCDQLMTELEKRGIAVPPPQ